MTPRSDPAGDACTLILRLRRDPESDGWRGQAICVQTGVAVPVFVPLDSAQAAEEIAAVVLRLLGARGNAA